MKTMQKHAHFSDQSSFKMNYGEELESHFQNHFFCTTDKRDFVSVIFVLSNKLMSIKNISHINH